MGDRPTRRRRRVWIATAALAIAVVATVVVLAVRTTPIERARALLTDQTRFETGLGAGETLAAVAEHLQQAVETCRGDDRGTRCSALSSALGYAQVLAAWVLDCTAPGLHEARTRMASYLEEVVALTADARRVPDPPRLPSCT